MNPRVKNHVMNVHLACDSINSNMNLKILDHFAATEIRPDSNLVLKHLRVLEEMVRIDSRSFSVNEFEGDRKTPSDMKEILNYASDYLQQIGFNKIKIN